MASMTRSIPLSKALDPITWRASLEVAEAVCDSASREAVCAQIMQVLDRLVGFDLAGIHSSAPGEAWKRGAEKGDTQVFLENNWRYMAEVLPEEAKRVSSGFSLDTDVFSARRREHMGIYREFLAPNHVASGLVHYWVTDGQIWLVALCRDRPSSYGHAQTRLELLSPHLRAALRAATWRANDDGNDNPPAAWQLTRAQNRIVSFVVRGLTNRETAALLGISTNTVRNTLAEVFKKAGVSRRSELAFLLRSGMTSAAEQIGRNELAEQRRFVELVADGSSRAIQGSPRQVAGAAVRAQRSRR
jgi:DNA-binding CsgD family transcriptional regulator